MLHLIKICIFANTNKTTRNNEKDSFGCGAPKQPCSASRKSGDRQHSENTWNGYLNMPGWPYEDFFFQEFVPSVEKKYRCYGDKGHRAVMGLSMGGGGSTIYAQRHPDLFSSCYAMSAWLESDGGRRQTEGIDDKVYLVSQAMKEHSALNFLRNADEETLQRLRTVKWFFDCGDDDFLFDLSVNIHRLMHEKRVKDELRIRNGVHNWEYWHLALRLALPFASRNFEQ